MSFATGTRDTQSADRPFQQSVFGFLCEHYDTSVFTLPPGQLCCVLPQHCVAFKASCSSSSIHQPVCRGALTESTAVPFLPAYVFISVFFFFFLFIYFIFFSSLRWFHLFLFTLEHLFLSLIVYRISFQYIQHSPLFFPGN